jgi:hypothetical protein
MEDPAVRLERAIQLDGRPTGDRLGIAGSCEERRSSSGFVLIPVEGGSPRVIQSFEQSTLPSGVAEFSPDGRWIIYDRTDEGVSYTRRIRFAQRRLSVARSGGVGMGSGEGAAESWALSFSSAFRR